jgi:hypothetical protein
MNEGERVATYPRIWHMAEDGSWPSIKKHGLLSTAELLDLHGVVGEQRSDVVSKRRRDCVTLRRAGLPKAVIRDQKPMSDAALRKCLDDGMTPQDWYELLNRKIFFWPSRARLRRLLGARAYRGKPQTVLTVRTETLVAAHRERILLCPINSGSTIRIPQRRGRDTFKTIADYPFEAWARKRASTDAVAELAIEGGVPDIAAHVLAVHRFVNGDPQELWRSPTAAAGDGP